MAYYPPVVKLRGQGHASKPACGRRGMQPGANASHAELSHRTVDADFERERRELAG